MRRLFLPLLFLFMLAACSPTITTSNPTAIPPFDSASRSTPVGQGKPAPVLPATPTPPDDPAQLATILPNSAGSGEMTRIDQQGAVVIEVTPLNLSTPSDPLEFDISMNTHSVDLGMDLATLATLTTDAGVTVQATLWDAPRGGHHVAGKLVFPGAKDGKSILEGARKITLTITNLDVPSRLFEWELN